MIEITSQKTKLNSIKRVIISYDGTGGDLEQAEVAALDSAG